MARKVTPLTDTQIKQAKPNDREITLSDGKGLQLRITISGTKSWIFKYHTPITKKRTNLTLGKYPAISLAKARTLANEVRELLAQDIDPKEHRENKVKERLKRDKNTFLNVTTQWFEIKQIQITPAYAEDIWRSLENHVFPTLGNSPIDTINAPLVIEILKPLEASNKLETVKRLSQRINEIMVYSVNTGLIHANPLAGIKSAFKKPIKTNNPALRPEELTELIRTVSNSSAKKVTKLLVMWQLHTMTRPSEASSVSWNELDLDNKLWIIPAERMKKRREHRIPLTEQMLRILEDIKPISGHRPFVFPADRNPLKATNEQTANALLKRIGFKDKTTAHGLRALASTTLNEQGFDYDVIEACLAHVDKDQVRSAYNRTDYLDRRRKVMVWWSERIEQAGNGEMLTVGVRGLRIA